MSAQKSLQLRDGGTKPKGALLLQLAGFCVLLGPVILACGCWSAPPVQPEKKRAYFFPVRQGAPQPVYNRLRAVRPPEPLPPRKAVGSSSPRILPVIHLELKNTPLEQASRVLAESARYSYYCSSLIAKEKLTIDSLGTIDELANQISKKKNINVVVDHQNREVRFLLGSTLAQANSGEVTAADISVVNSQPIITELP